MRYIAAHDERIGDLDGRGRYRPLLARVHNLRRAAPPPRLAYAGLWESSAPILQNPLQIPLDTAQQFTYLIYGHLMGAR